MASQPTSGVAQALRVILPVMLTLAVPAKTKNMINYWGAEVTVFYLLIVIMRMILSSKFLHLAAVALVFGGCTSTVPVLPGQSFSLERTSTLHFKDGKRLTVRDASIKDDLLIYTTKLDGQEKWQRSYQPLSAVEKLRVTNRVKGALQGLGLGPVAGLSAGLLLGPIIYSLEPPCDFECYFDPGPVGTALILGVVGSFWGLILGPPMGVLVGAKQDFVFHDSTSSPKPRSRQSIVPDAVSQVSIPPSRVVSPDVAKVFISGSFAPKTFNGNYYSGGGKIGYDVNKSYLLYARFLAESLAGSGSPGRHMYEVMEFSILFGPRLLNKHGYLSAMVGGGIANTEMINFNSTTGETREKESSPSLAIDIEAIKFLGENFGFGLTGFGNLNLASSTSGIMLSVQIRGF